MIRTKTNKYCSYELRRFDGIAEMNKLGAKKSAARLGSALKTVKIFWEIWALMQEGRLLCLPEIDTYCAFRLA